MVRSTGRRGAAGELHGRRLGAVLAAGLAAWAIILLRLVFIQVVHSGELGGFADRQHVVRVRLAPERGTIYDRCGVALTENLTVPSICAYPSEIRSPSLVARRLAAILGGSEAHYRAKLSSGREFVWIARQVAPSVAARVEGLGLSGIGFHNESKRIYPLGRRACHVVGLTDVDGMGLSGIEKQVDEYLTGSEAWVCHSLDSAGRRTPTPACTKVVPRDGLSVVLTIDAELQSIAEVELERTIREHEAKSGTIVIQDPHTGEILAMANWPSFDPNRPDRYTTDSRRNRAITDQFEPGSTFKVVTACAALSTGSADLESVYHASRGQRRFAALTIHDVKPKGWLTFPQALWKSSNVCFAEIARDVGAMPLYSLARDFGFGVPTGIALPGEVRGVLREPDRWSARSVHTIGIGQEVAVTALQLGGAYSAVANGGYLMEPLIVKAVVTDDGQVVEASRPWEVRRVLEPELAATMRELLVGVTEHGTGTKAAVPEFHVAGKTGTAQKVVEGTRGYAPGKFVASFVGFLPADDPRLVCIVVVDEPKGRGLGGEVAAPAFARIVERIARGPACELVFGGDGAPKSVEGGVFVARSGRPLGEVPREERQSTEHMPALFASASSHLGSGRGAFADRAGGYSALMEYASRTDDDRVDVPDLVGASLRKARSLAASAGLVLKYEGTGVVRTQSPRPGVPVEPGHTVMARCRPR